MAFQHDIAGGQGNLIVTALQSPAFQTGIQGWQIRKDGSVEFNNGTFRGTISGGTLIIAQGSGATFEQFKIDGATGITTWSKYQSPTVVIRQILANGTDLTYVDPGNGGAQGALLASSSPVKATDGFGNTYFKGITSYGTATAATLFNSGPDAALLFSLLTALHSTTSPQVFGALNNAGASEFAQATMTSGAESGGDDAALQLFSEAADGSNSAQLAVAFGGNVEFYSAHNSGWVPVQPGTANTPETWHPMTLSNGWTVASGGVARYKLMSDRTVMVQLSNLTPGTIADGTTIWSIPAGYIPGGPSTWNFAVQINYTAAPAFGSNPFVAFRNTGTMTCQNFRGTVANFGVVATYALS